MRSATTIAVSILPARYSLADLLRASDALWQHKDALAWGLKTTSPAPDGSGLQIGVPGNTHSPDDWRNLAGVDIADITEENPMPF